MLRVKGLSKRDVHCEATRDARRKLPPLDSQEIGRSEQRIISKTDAAIKAVEARLKRSAARATARLRVARDAVERAQRDLNYVSATEEERPVQGWNRALRIGVLAFLGIVEALFNIAVFHRLGDSVLATWALAIVTSLVVVLGAHFTGVTVRQWEHQSSGMKWLTLVFVICLFPLVVGLNVTRLHAAQKRADGLLDPLFAFMVFGGANLTLFIVAAIVSYIAHDPHPDFEKAHRAHKRFGNRIHRLENRLDALRERLVCAAKRLEEFGTERVQYYQTINARARRDGVPARFHESLRLDFYQPDIEFFDHLRRTDRKPELSNVAAIPQDEFPRFVPRRSNGVPDND